ncbi:endonuclease SmrB [Aestuariibacter halophilus]|uniref:Ribosome rescue factor SmrB n=1 Tax=Fluctibacter halophilus TaxID=226011 RepID=A0ABS8G8I8_9ALTE|nr:endonuclease SmrB [Aestuariibacter halophilus]MCC2616743.1 endonuclease SmrB [Aestuariibacter halophilus]
MKKPSDLDPDDGNWFRDQFKDVAPLKQDKIPPPRKTGKDNLRTQAKRAAHGPDPRQVHAQFHFSDQYQAHFDSQGPLKWVREGADTFEVKRLRRGEYPPDLILDLHGLTREQAKLEIAALVHAAQQQQYHCVCIVHGVGGQILKQQVPHWLVQHPAILCFHQAPLEWGGQGALLALIDLPRDTMDRR